MCLLLAQHSEVAVAGLVVAVAAIIIMIIIDNV